MISNETKTELSSIRTINFIDLWEINTGNGVFRFTNEANQKREPKITWQGNDYISLPVSFEGFSESSGGVSNRPQIMLSNISGMFTGLISELDGMIGLEIIRYRVPDKFLDAVNFKSGNDDADPNQFVIQTYVINSLDEQSVDLAIFSLASPFELEGLTAPTKTMMAGVCQWDYRGVGCGYNKGAVADENDLANNDIAKDSCSKSLLGCKARFGENAVLPFLAFVGIDKLQR